MVIVSGVVIVFRGSVRWSLRVFEGRAMKCRKLGIVFDEDQNGQRHVIRKVKVLQLIPTGLIPTGEF